MVRKMEFAARIRPDRRGTVFGKSSLAVKRRVGADQIVDISVLVNGRVVGVFADKRFAQCVHGNFAVDI